MNLQPLAVPVPCKRDLTREILAALNEGEFNNKDLSFKLGVDRSLLGSYLSVLHARGKIQRRGEPRKYVWFA